MIIYFKLIAILDKNKKILTLDKLIQVKPLSRLFFTQAAKVFNPSAPNKDDRPSMREKQK